MNQISLANVMMNFHMNKSDELEEDMVRSYFRLQNNTILLKYYEKFME